MKGDSHEQEGQKPEAPKYWAFISYSQEDSAWGDWLHRAIERYRVPRRLVGTQGRDFPVPRRLFPVFRDRDELTASADLGGQLRQSLRDSSHLIVVCSPRSARSRWVNQEILEFKKLGRADRILALIVDGTPNGGGDQECFPPALRYALDESGELSDRRVEPVAADVRPGKDSRRHALLKLIAGLIGVDYDSLKQRDAQRRRRVVLGWLAFSALAIATAYGLVEQERRAGEERIALASAIRAKESGRNDLLRGDLLEAARHLDDATSTLEDDASLRLLRGTALRRLQGLEGAYCLPTKDDVWTSVSPGGGRLGLSVFGGAVAGIWEVGQPDPLWFSTRDSPRFVFDESGDQVLLRWSDGTTTLRNLETGAEQAIPMRGAAFTDDGHLVWLDGEEQRIVLFDPNEERTVRTLPVDVEGGGEIEARGGTAVVRYWAEGAGRILWLDLTTGETLFDGPAGESDDVRSLSPDGAALVYATDDPEGYAVVTSTGRSFRLSEPWEEPLGWGVAGATIVSQSPEERGTLRVRELESGQVVRQVEGVGEVSDAGGGRFASVHGDEIQVFSSDGTSRRTIFRDRVSWHEEGTGLQQARFLYDGSLVVVSEAGSCARVWEADAVGAEPNLVAVEGQSVLAHAVHPGGELVATFATDGGVRLHRLEDPQKPDLVASVGDGDVSVAHSVALRFAAGGKWLVAGWVPFVNSQADGVLSIWNAETGERAFHRSWQDESAVVPQYAAVGNDAIFAMNGHTGRGFALDPNRLEVRGVLHAEPPAGEGMEGSAFLHDVAVGGTTGLAVWGRGHVEAFDVGAMASIGRLPFSGAVIHAEVDSTGRRVLVLSDDGESTPLVIRSAEGEDPGRELHTGHPILNHATLNASGTHVAAGGRDDRVYVWTLDSDEPPLVLQAEPPPEDGSLPDIANIPEVWDGRLPEGMVAVTFLPLGPWVAGLSTSGGISVWDTESGEQLLYFAQPKSRYVRMSVSEDGRWLSALSEDDRKPRLYEIATDEGASLSARLNEVTIGELPAAGSEEVAEPVVDSRL